MTNARLCALGFILLSFGALVSEGIQASKWGNLPVKPSTNDVASSTQEHKINALTVNRFEDVLLKGEDNAKGLCRGRRAAKYTAELDRQREARRQTFLRYQRLRQKWQRQRLEEQLQQKKMPNEEQSMKTNIDQRTYNQRQQEQQQQQQPQEERQNIHSQKNGSQSSSQKPQRPQSSSHQQQERLSATERIEKWRLINRRRLGRQSSRQVTETPSTFSHSTETDHSTVQRHTGEIRGLDGDRDNDHSSSPQPSKTSSHPQGTNANVPSEFNHQSQSHSRQEFHQGQDASVSATFKSKPRYRSLERQKSSKTSDLHEKPHVSPMGFMSEITTIYPFIPTTRALDYLTRYDSVTLPKRWPVKMILPQTEPPEKKSPNKLAVDHTSASERQIVSPTQLSVQSAYNSSKDPEVQVIRSDLDIDEIEEDLDTSFDASEGSGAQSGETVNDTNVLESKKKNGVDKKIKRKKKDKDKRKLAKNTDEEDHDRSEREERKRQRRLLKRLERRKRRQRRKRRRQKARNEEETTTPPPPPPQVVAEYPASKQSDLTNPQSVSAMSSHDQPSHSREARKESYRAEENAGKKADAHHGKDTSTVSGILSQAPVNSHETSESYDETKGKKLKDDRSNSAQSEKVWSDEHDEAHRIGSSAKEEIETDAHGQFNDIISTTSDSKSPPHSSLSHKTDVNTKPYFVQVSSANEHTQTTRGKALLHQPFYDVTASNSDASDNARSSTPDGRLSKRVYDRMNSDPENERKSTGADRRWSVSQEFWDNTNLSTADNSSVSSSFPHRNTNSSLPLLRGRAAPTLNVDVRSTTEALHSGSGRSSESITSGLTPPTTPRPRQSASSAAKRWRDRLKKRRQKHNDDDFEDTEEDLRRGSMAVALATSTEPEMESKSETTTSDSQDADVEEDEKGPFIGYKTAYDFLSSQKGSNKATAQNEARREANEMNRFMGEGMCEIFNKHYVPTRIGGKCV